MDHLDGTSAKIQSQIDQNELVQFNNNFFAYEAKECTIYDILSVVNMAKSFNEEYGYSTSDADYYIKVSIGGTDITSSLKLKSIEDDVTAISPSYGHQEGLDFKLNKYKASVSTSTLTGRVNFINFIGI